LNSNSIFAFGIIPAPLANIDSGDTSIPPAARTLDANVPLISAPLAPFPIPSVLLVAAAAPINPANAPGEVQVTTVWSYTVGP